MSPHPKKRGKSHTQNSNLKWMTLPFKSWFDWSNLPSSSWHIPPLLWHAHVSSSFFAGQGTYTRAVLIAMHIEHFCNLHIRRIRRQFRKPLWMIYPERPAATCWKKAGWQRNFEGTCIGNWWNDWSNWDKGLNKIKPFSESAESAKKPGQICQLAYSYAFVSNTSGCFFFRVSSPRKLLLLM